MKKQEQEQILKKKATTYMVCFNDNCQQHEQCLRWKVSQYVPEEVYSVLCISPHYSKYLEGKCDMFRSAEIIRMPIGLTGFYNDMPGWMERKVKNTLIGELGRTNYYKYHRGDRPIPPTLQERIEKLCKEEGWEQPLKYDDYIEDFLW